MDMESLIHLIHGHAHKTSQLNSELMDITTTSLPPHRQTAPLTPAFIGSGIWKPVFVCTLYTSNAVNTEKSVQSYILIIIMFVFSKSLNPRYFRIILIF